LRRTVACLRPAEKRPTEEDLRCEEQGVSVSR
jgi:hypothetical protein